jgi:hypothetical protein
MLVGLVEPGQEFVARIIVDLIQIGLRLVAGRLVDRALPVGDRPAAMIGCPDGRAPEIPLESLRRLVAGIGLGQLPDEVAEVFIGPLGDLSARAFLDGLVDLILEILLGLGLAGLRLSILLAIF